MPLHEIIAAEIRERGPMPFWRFMELALYHAEHGYYAGGRARVGRAGDFFTNVSVGSLFGRLMAAQFREMHELLGGKLSIVEQGAHGGEFAGDVLGVLPDADYTIVEPLAALAAIQRARLAGRGVRWCESLDTLPPFQGVHFSNELPDAFPVHVVKWTGAKWIERCVACEGGTFAFCDAAVVEGALAEACARIPQPLPPGYTTEVNLAACRWIAQVASRIERGFVLAVDYGFLRGEYYAPERIGGTLSAYRAHRRVRDPLESPGATDITAHVEFSSLIEAGEAAGLRLTGFTDQHHFMVGIGAEHFADGAHAEDRRAFQTLMHPQFMGMAFKVVCFAKGIEPPPLAGFRFVRPVA